MDSVNRWVNAFQNLLPKWLALASRWLYFWLIFTTAVALFFGLVPHAFAPSLPFVHLIIDASNPERPTCKALGDIDGDGFIDALVASSRDEGMYWYEYPSWIKHTIRASGSWSTDMQVGDVDGDGDLDIIAPDRIDLSGLKWYENPRPTGDPRTDTWNEHFIGGDGYKMHDVEVADVDSDGDLDVVTRKSGGSLSIFWRQETPVLWTAITISTRSGEGTSLGDIDGDGDVDVAHNGFWVEQDSPINWIEHDFDLNWPVDVGVLITDINGDGSNDIVVAPSESANERFSWYEAADPINGPWTEHIIDPLTSYFHTFKAFDMDDDGDLDLVTAEMHQSTDPDEISVYFNNGKAMSWSQLIVAASGGHNIRVGDIGSDGDYDIYGANWSDAAPNSAVIEIWESQLNEGVLSLDLWQRHVIETSLPWKVVFVEGRDVNGDNLPDLVTGGWWYPNPGTLDGIWSRTTIGAPLNNMATLHDFDEDGDLDILGVDGKQNGENFSWGRNDGSGNFTLFNIATAVSGGDFLQGVNIDQVIPGGKEEIIISWHNEIPGTTMFSIPSDPTLSNWPLNLISSTTNGEEVPTGYIDDDGLLDVHLGPTWLRQLSDGSFVTETGVSLSSGHADRVLLTDIDADGDLDVIIGSADTQLLIWGENQNNGAIWIEHIIATDVKYYSVDVSDIDGDGDIDVVGGSHQGNGEVFIYENAGQGSSWITHTVDLGDEELIDHHDGTQLVDMDLDGDLDIISVGWQYRSLVIYENLAITGSAEPRPPIAFDSSVITEEDEPVNILLQATDPDGDQLNYIIITEPTNGTLTGVAPSLTYTPEPLFNGADSFNFQVDDGNGGIDSATVSITVNPASNGNQPPIASDTSVVTEVNVPVSIVLLATDSDGDPLSYSIISGPSNGNLSGTAPALTYTPNTLYSGPDSFDFQVDDGRGGIDFATVSITVNPASGGNQPPVASDAEVVTDEDVAVNIILQASDPNGDPLNYSIVVDPLNGILSGIAPSLTYTPNSLYSGPDAFDFQVDDGNGGTDTATVSITVNPDSGGNQQPIASDASVVTDEGVAVNITLQASDPDGDSLSYSIIAEPTNGTLSGTAPALTYTPDSLYSGPDFFDFQVDDGNGGVDAATISITVNPAGIGLVAYWPMNEGAGTTTVDATGNGNTGVLVNGPTWTSGPALDFDGINDYVDVGTLDLTGTAMTITGWFRTDNLSNCSSRDCRIISKATGTSSQDHYFMISTVKSDLTTRLRFRLKTGGVTTKLVASSGDVVENQWIHVAAIYDGAMMRLYMDGIDVGSAAKTGNITSNSTTPVWIGANPLSATDKPWSGQIDDVRIYNRALTSQEVQQLFSAGNLPPIANNAAVVTEEDVAVNITLQASDPDGDPLNYSIVAGPSNGTLSGTVPSLTYTPNALYSGPDSFDFQVDDGNGGIDTATVSITINPASGGNQPPAAGDASVVTDEDVAVNITLQASDPDGDSLSYSIIAGPTNGTLSGTAPALTYTPNALYSGSDSFDFQVDDGNGGIDTATVSIIINPASGGNQPPVASDASVVTDEEVAVNITLQASDPDGDPLSYSIIAGPTNGTLSGAAPALTYTPNALYSGPDSFDFQADDGNGGTDTATISITVNPASAGNQPPVASDAAVVTDEEVAVNITLQASDPDGDSLSYSVIAEPTNGTLSGTAPALTYTPNALYSGPDFFDFQVDDGNGGVDAATISITVNPAGIGLVAYWPMNEGAGTTTVDATGNGNTGVLVNGPTWTSGPALDFDGINDYVDVGTLDLTGTAMTITGWFRTDNLSNCSSRDCRIISKATGTSSQDHYFMISTVKSDLTTRLRFRLKTGGVTTKLVASSGDVVENQWIHVAAIYDGAMMRLYMDGIDVGSAAKTGNITSNSTTPVWIGANPLSATDKPWSGQIDDVRIYNRALTSQEVQQLFSAGNLPPIANNAAVVTEEDVAVNITLQASDPDGDPLNYSIVAGPSNGTLSGTVPSLTYTPNALYSGPDSFDFQVDDGNGGIDTATVSITINPASGGNQPPAAGDASVVTDEDVAVNITLQASDPDGDSLSYSIIAGPTNGTLSGTAPALTYTPNALYSGSDSFDFQVDDGNGGIDTATVSIIINPASGGNQPPVASDASVVTDEEVAVNITLQASDPDGDPLSYSIIAGPTNGTLSGAAPALTYTPNALYSGPDSFDFQADDGNGGTDTATISITVNPASAGNQPPVASDAAVVTDEEVAVNITLQASDPDGDSLSYSVIAEPTNGTLSGTAPALTYTPNALYSGPDFFDFQVDDGNGGVDAATISITVNPAGIGLIAYWPMNEGAGTATVDATGNGNTGVLVNGPVWTSGPALNFDGIDDYVDVGTLDVTGTAITLTAWFRADNLSNCSSRDCRLISKATGTSSKDHYFMLSTARRGSTTRLRFRLKADGVTTKLIASSGDVVENQWIHVAAVYDGATMQLYMDGIDVGSAAKTGAITSNSTTPVWIGANPPNATDKPWSGQIDDVRIYNRALTLQEVMKLVSEGR